MQESNKKLIIGIGGCARAGKDTFASILEAKLKANGRTVKKIALATPLKTDCVEFLANHLKIDAYTQVSSEKNLIRPMLVWYGDAQRKLTGGRYWIDKAASAIEAVPHDYYIITDVRYDFYEKDELYWLQTECRGVVCHVSRYYLEAGGVRDFVQPPNEHERENDPKIKAKANFVVEWESVEGKTVEELVLDKSLNAHVDAFMEKFNIN